MINAFGSAAAGALLGSLSAFYLGIRQQRKDKRDKEHAAMLQTQYALMSQWNVLEGIRRNLLEADREAPDRFLKLPVYYSFGRAAMVPFPEIGYVAATNEPNLLQEIHIAEQAFETAIEALRVRNEKTEEFYNSPDVEILEFDRVTGKSRVRASEKDIFLIRKSTDILYQTIDRALPKLLGETQAIEAFIKRHFKGLKSLTLIPK